MVQGVDHHLKSSFKVILMTLTIGKLAKEVGVNIQTIRYYERRKLLNPTDRKPSGYRVYESEALKRL